jgi:spore coat polysaccharide biosynthesis protein SpsF (cytidylyltransferase family)
VTKPNAIAVCGIQARMGSTRLPGKSLADLAGRPLVHRVWERARRAVRVTEAVVLTSTDAADDPLAAYCESEGIPVRRGPLDDVLERYLELLEEHHTRYLVRVTGDCPLIDPGFIDLQLDALEAFDGDLCVPSCGPAAPALAGQGALSARALWRAAESDDPRDREHVGAFWLAEHRAELRAVEVEVDPTLAHWGLRLCVDEEPDLAFVRAVWDAFALEFDPGFRLADVLRGLGERADLTSMNAAVVDSDVNRDARAAERVAPDECVGRWP